MRARRWGDLAPHQKSAILIAASVQLTLAATAWLDLARRPPEAVRGNKALWAAAIAVNFVGPISYLTFGIKRTASRHDRTSELSRW